MMADQRILSSCRDVRKLLKMCVPEEGQLCPVVQRKSFQSLITLFLTNTAYAWAKLLWQGIDPATPQSLLHSEEVNLKKWAEALSTISVDGHRLAGWAGCPVLVWARSPADWAWMLDHGKLSQGGPSYVSGDKGCSVNGPWKDASLVWVLSYFCSVSNNTPHY